MALLLHGSLLQLLHEFASVITAALCLCPVCCCNEAAYQVLCRLPQVEIVGANTTALIVQDLGDVCNRQVR